METPFSQFINLITLFFVSILILAGILIAKSVQKDRVAEIERGFCGVTPNYIDNEQMSLGDYIFGSQCATCHAKKYAYQRYWTRFGEYLAKWNNDTTALFSYIRNPQQYLKKHPESRIARVHEEFGSATMNGFPMMTKEELEALMVYIDP